MIEQLIINSLIASSIYALVAMGFVVIYRTVKFFHFAHGVVYTAGAYLAYTFSISFGLNAIISFFLPQSWRVSLAYPLTGSSILLCAGRKPLT